MNSNTKLSAARNMRRVVQAARLDRRLADYWACRDYDGGPGDDVELSRITAADHYTLQNWLRHNGKGLTNALTRLTH